MCPHRPGSMPAVPPTAGPTVVPGVQPAPAPGGLSLKDAGRGVHAGGTCPSAPSCPPCPPGGTQQCLLCKRDSRGVLEGHCPGLGLAWPPLSLRPAPALPVELGSGPGLSGTGTRRPCFDHQGVDRAPTWPARHAFQSSTGRFRGQGPAGGGRAIGHRAHVLSLHSFSWALAGMPHQLRTCPRGKASKSLGWEPRTSQGLCILPPSSSAGP